jgi:hypothetical protein
MPGFRRHRLRNLPRQLLDPAPKKDAPLNSLEALFQNVEIKP